MMPSASFLGRGIRLWLNISSWSITTTGASRGCFLPRMSKQTRSYSPVAGRANGRKPASTRAAVNVLSANRFSRLCSSPLMLLWIRTPPTSKATKECRASGPRLRGLRSGNHHGKVAVCLQLETSSRGRRTARHRQKRTRRPGGVGAGRATTLTSRLLMPQGRVKHGWLSTQNYRLHRIRRVAWCVRCTCRGTDARTPGPPAAGRLSAWW